MRSLLIASLLICLLAIGAEFVRAPGELTSAPVSREGASDLMIVPGLRIDFCTLGLPVAQVEKKLGLGKIKPTDQATLYHFKPNDMTTGVQNERVVSVLSRDPSFRTRAGTHVGSAVDDVVREYGDQYEYEKLEHKEDYYTLHYWKLGIHFTVNANIVQSIMVTASLNQDEHP